MTPTGAAVKSASMILTAHAQDVKAFEACLRWTLKELQFFCTFTWLLFSTLLDKFPPKEAETLHFYSYLFGTSVVYLTDFLTDFMFFLIMKTLLQKT